jgi:hypothetical protein
MELWDAEDYSGLDARLNNFLRGRGNSTFTSNEEFNYFEDAVNNLDFSSIDGGSDDFKKIFRKVNRTIDNNKRLSPNNVSAQSCAPFGQNKSSRVVVPRDKPVIVENVSKFILSQTRKDEALKNIGYKDGKKLKELVLVIANDSDIDFNVNLFDPSMPLDYLYSTSQNLNDKIIVQGGLIQYTDVLFNILANPVMIHNAYCTVSGSNSDIERQVTVPIQFKNKNLQGHVLIDPFNLSLTIDTMQVANNIISFNFQQSIGRPYFPDGMDTMNYTVYANTNVTMAFFYEQISLKKVFYEEARKSKRLL